MILLSICPEYPFLGATLYVLAVIVRRRCPCSAAHLRHRHQVRHLHTHCSLQVCCTAQHTTQHLQQHTAIPERQHSSHSGLHALCCCCCCWLCGVLTWQTCSVTAVAARVAGCHEADEAQEHGTQQGLQAAAGHLRQQPTTAYTGCS